MLVASYKKNIRYAVRLNPMNISLDAIDQNRQRLGHRQSNASIHLATTIQSPGAQQLFWVPQYFFSYRFVKSELDICKRYKLKDQDKG